MATAVPFAGGGAHGITYDGSQWVAVGNDSSYTVQVATSTTGNCWTPQATVTGVTYGTSIDWSPSLSLFCMGGSGTSVIATSPDGITWTTQTTPMDGNIVRGVSWVGWLGLFIATGQGPGATVTIMTSPDGTTWTARTSPFDFVTNAGDTGASVADDGSGIVVVSGVSLDAGIIVATSTDGVTWTAQTTPLDGGFIAGIAVAYSLDLTQFVVTGTFGALMTSPDGVTWTVQTMPGGTSGSVNGNGVGWSSSLGLWVLSGQNVGGSSVAIVTSTDGVVWSPVASGYDGTSGAVQPIWAGGQWILGGFGVSLNFVLSPDGSTWTNAVCTAPTTMYAHGFV